LTGYIIVDNKQSLPSYLNALVDFGFAEGFDLEIKTCNELFFELYSGKLLRRSIAFAVMMCASIEALSLLNSFNIKTYNGKASYYADKKMLYPKLFSLGIPTLRFLIQPSKCDEAMQRYVDEFTYPCTVEWSNITGIAADKNELLKLCGDDESKIIYEKNERNKQSVMFSGYHVGNYEVDGVNLAYALRTAKALDIVFGTVELFNVVEAINLLPDLSEKEGIEAVKYLISYISENVNEGY